MEYTGTLGEMIAAVKDHAHPYYNINGWDILVETMDDDAIAEVIGKCRTNKGAILKMSYHLAPAHAMCAEIIATAF